MHGWIPKLTARLFNMNLNNAYKIYYTLVANEEGQSYEPKEIWECILATAHAMLQQGQFCPICPIWWCFVHCIIVRSLDLLPSVLYYKDYQ